MKKPTNLFTGALIMGTTIFSAMPAGAVTGEVTIRTERKCSSTQADNMRNAAFLMRISTSNAEYADFLDRFIRSDYVPQNVRLSREPFIDSPVEKQVEMALQASRSANNVRITCRRNLAFAHGRAWGENAHDQYFEEQIKIDRTSLSRSFEDAPNPVLDRTGTILHEIMHLFGYDHYRHNSDDYQSSMNQTARRAMRTYINTRFVFPALSSGPCQTLSQCRSAGHLVYRRPDGSIRPSFDPSRRGTGILQASSNGHSLDLRDAALVGNRYGAGGLDLSPRGSSGSPVWDVTPGEPFRIAADFARGSATGKDFVLRQRGGWRVIRWSPRSDGPGFSVLYEAPFAGSRSGDTGGWQPETNTAAYTLSRPEGDLIVFRDSGNLVLVDPANIQPERHRIRAGQRLPSTIGAVVNFANDMRIFGTGDFDGDGQDELLVGNDDGLGIMDLRSLAFRPNLVLTTWSTSAPGWSPRTDGGRASYARIADFDGDGADEWIIRNGEFVVMSKLANRDIRRIASLRNGERGLSSRDRIIDTVALDDGAAEQVLVEGERGLGVLRYFNRGLNIALLHPYDRAIPSIPGVTSPISFPRRTQILSLGDILPDAGRGTSGAELMLRNTNGYGVVTVVKDRGRAIRLLTRDYQNVTCSASLETCHRSLWGNWRVRAGDRASIAFETRSGDRYVTIANYKLR